MEVSPTETSLSVQKIIDTYNSHRVDSFDALLTDDCTLVRNRIEASGRDAVKRALANVYRAFPDIQYRVDDAITCGNKMTLRWQGRATHRGEYLGVAATGKNVTYDGITIYELRGNKIAHMWVSTDMMALARELRGA